MNALIVCRGAPGLGRVVPSIGLIQTLAATSPVTARFVSYGVGAKYLHVRGEDVIDLGSPDGLFIDSVSSQAVKIVELAEGATWDLILIDGEFFLPPTLTHLDAPLVYLANPHDLLGQPNIFRRVNRLLLAYADAVLISSLACVRPTTQADVVPGTPCLEVPPIIKDFPVRYRPTHGPPRVLLSTGGGSCKAHPGFRAATDAALARVLGCLAELAASDRIAQVTIVLGTDAHQPARWKNRQPRWLDIIQGPVELTDLYAHHELAIVRAGRNAAAEAGYCGIPAILLPVTADPHRGGEQASNAQVLAHMPNIFALHNWQKPAALRQTLNLALAYAQGSDVISAN